MGLSANEFRHLAQVCFNEAEITSDHDGKQMLLAIARLYNQTAVHIDARELASSQNELSPLAV